MVPLHLRGSGKWDRLSRRSVESRRNKSRQVGEFEAGVVGFLTRVVKLTDDSIVTLAL